MASTFRDLDAALARNVALETEAAEWKIRALRAEKQSRELKAEIENTTNVLYAILDELGKSR